MSIDELRHLQSNDYPDKRIEDLQRDDYPNRAFVFDDLLRDISKNGIKTPLRVVNNRLVDGHHRAIIAIELGLDGVMVEYSGHYMGQ